MNIARCDDCCDVIDGVNDGVVLTCDEPAYLQTGYEHLCTSCIDSNDELTSRCDGVVVFF